MSVNNNNSDSEWDATAYMFEDSNCVQATKKTKPATSKKSPTASSRKDPPQTRWQRQMPVGRITSIPEDHNDDDQEEDPTMTQSDRLWSTRRVFTKKTDRRRYSNRSAIAMSMSEHNHSTRRASDSSHTSYTNHHHNNTTNKSGSSRLHPRSCTGEVDSMTNNNNNNNNQTLKDDSSQRRSRRDSRRVRQAVAKQQATLAAMDVDLNNSGVTDASEFHDETTTGTYTYPDQEFADRYLVATSTKNSNHTTKSSSSRKSKSKQSQRSRLANTNGVVVEYNPKKWGSDATDDLTEHSLDLDYLNYQNQVDPLTISRKSHTSQGNNNSRIQRQPSSNEAADIRNHASWLLHKFPLDEEYQDVEMGRLGSHLPQPDPQYLETKRRTRSTHDEIKKQQRMRCLGILLCFLTVSILLLGGVVLVLVLTQSSALNLAPTETNGTQTVGDGDVDVLQDRTVNVMSGTADGDYQLQKVLVVHSEQREALLEYDWNDIIPESHDITYTLYDGNQCSNGATDITDSSLKYMTTTLHPDFVPNSQQTVVAVQLELTPTAIMYTPVYRSAGMLGGNIGVCVGLTVRDTDNDQVVHELEHFVTMGWNAQYMQITGATVAQITGPL